MSWNDRPTVAQLSALANLIKWVVSTEEEKLILDHLKNNSTRRGLSIELKRVRDLYISRRLDHDNVWDSPIYKTMQR